MSEDFVRSSALAWLANMTGGGELPLTRDQLANDFIIGGQRFPLIDRGRGIRKPQGWTAAFSITTSVPKRGQNRPYEDVEGPDGLHRYKLRRDDGGTAENAGLRAALVQDVPLAWFYGLQPSLFQ